MSIFVEFSLLFLLAQALLTAAQIPLRKKTFRPLPRIGLIVGKALLAILFAFLVLAGPVQLRVVQPLMMALYVALLMDAFSDAVYSVILLIKKTDRHFGVQKTLSLVFGVLFFVFGVVNMETVRPNYHSYTSAKLTTEHKIVFLADLHVGSAQPFSVTEKTIKEIKALQPEATILGGDIVDDYTTKEEMEAAFALFADFETPVYYVYGNHDRQGHAEYAGGLKFTPEELEQAITSNGIVILKDTYALLAPDLQLLGREDLSEESRKDASRLPNPHPEAYLIVADHQPNDFEEQNAASESVVGADLQLSGHTHAGQLFPLKSLYALIGGSVYGDYNSDFNGDNGKESVMNVSAGACGWRMPLRTEAHCYYEVITLKPAE